MTGFAVTVRGGVVTAAILRAHGWREQVDQLEHATGGGAVFTDRGAAEEFAAWMARTFPEPADRVTLLELPVRSPADTETLSAGARRIAPREASDA